MADLNEFNRKIIAEFRDNAGIVGGPFKGVPLLLLHTTGAKSGKPRIHPLAYFEDAGRLVVIASKAGSDTNPDWYHNVVAHTLVEVEVGGERFSAEATVAPEPERTRLYDTVAAKNSAFADYQAKTSRVIPVVLLTRG